VPLLGARGGAGAPAAGGATRSGGGGGGSGSGAHGLCGGPTPAAAAADAEFYSELGRDEVLARLAARIKRLQAKFSSVATTTSTTAAAVSEDYAALWLETTPAAAARALHRSSGGTSAAALSSTPTAIMAAMLHLHMTAHDAAAAPRLRLDCAADGGGAGDADEDAADNDEDAAVQGAAVEAARRRDADLVFLADLPLSFAEFVWGVARLAFDHGDQDEGFELALAKLLDAIC
jgi:hypothetical protein